MSDSGAPLTPKEQEEILNKLRTEFPRDEWIPAISRSTARRWRSVFRRKEDRKTAAAKKQRDAWSEAVPAEETERLIRLTEEMEADE